MPGIVGFTTSGRGSKDNVERQLSAMLESLNHMPEKYRKESLFINESIAASAIHKNVFYEWMKSFSTEGIRVWADGEIYYKSAWHSSFEASTPAAEVLCKLFKEKGNWNFLKDIDGIFSAVVYDRESNKIYFITDRYGLGYLYLNIEDDRIAWASESKAFLQLDGFSPKIREEGVHDFLEYGYHRGDKSWLGGAELLSPGTVMTYDLKDKNISEFQYWSYDTIKKLNPAECKDEAAIAKELGRLLIQSVENRSAIPDEVRLSVPLSGGLDSRAILAVLNQKGKEPFTLTFGKERALDIEIAKEVARLGNNEHEVCIINENNWYFPRLKGIWWSDGEMNLWHLHSMISLTDISYDSLYSLNGFLAGGILGGIYIQKEEKESTIINNRGRRFIRHGPRSLNMQHQVALPFMDNKFLEFTMSLPDHLRADWYIYIKMLMIYFPEYFKNIPWAQSGRPITAEKGSGSSRMYKIYQKIKYRIRDRDDKVFFDYRNWLLNHNVRSAIDALLFSDEEVILYEFVDKNSVKKEWEKIKQKQGDTQLMCKYITMESYFRKVYSA